MRKINRNSFVYVDGERFTKTQIRKLVKIWSAAFGRRVTRREAAKL